MFRSLATLCAAASTAFTLCGLPVAQAEPTPAPAADTVASAGCGPTAAPPGTSIERFTGSGKSGVYIRDIPDLPAGRPAPLVVDLHGYLEPAMIEHSGTGIGRFGLDHGFATITPELDQPGFPRWDPGPGSPDIAYLSELLTHIETTACVDQRRIYVTGLSLGAAMTSSLACRLADRIAAVAPVAGLQNYPWCIPARPMPTIAFHGTEDPFVSYHGGMGPTGALLPTLDGPLPFQPQPIPDQAAAWATRNGCAATPAQQQIGSDITVTSYRCPTAAEVRLYTVAGGGHTWPGSTSPVYPAAMVGATTTTIDANMVIWDFFQAHPLPRQ